jgi:hypothetical protein
MNLIWSKWKCQTATTTATDKEFADSAQTALFGTANGEKVAILREQNDVVFT